MVQYKTYERNSITKNIKVYLEFRVVNVHQMSQALVHRFQGAKDVRAEDYAKEIYVFLSPLDVLQQQSSLGETMDAFLLSDIAQPCLKFFVILHALLQLLLRRQVVPRHACCL
jgi:hypothetical protein